MGLDARLGIRAAAMVSIVLAAAGCAPLPAPPSPSPADATADPIEGRSRCPGSAPVARTDLRGEAADAVEALGARYDARAGFRAVVFDGTRPIVVVDAAQLPAWLAELTPQGIGVAASCIDPELLAAVHSVLAAVAPPDGIASAGYDGIADAIFVSGVQTDALVAAVDAASPGMGARALAAIAAGTLRIDESIVRGGRG